MHDCECVCVCVWQGEQGYPAENCSISRLFDKMHAIRVEDCGFHCCAQTKKKPTRALSWKIWTNQTNLVGLITGNCIAIKLELHRLIPI